MIQRMNTCIIVPVLSKMLTQILGQIILSVEHLNRSTFFMDKIKTYFCKEIISVKS